MIDVVDGVVLVPDYDSASRAIIRPNLALPIPLYFYHRWLPSGRIDPHQALAWQVMVAWITQAQRQSAQPLCVRLVVPLRTLGEHIGIRSPTTLRSKIVKPVQAGDEISRFILSAEEVPRALYDRFREGAQRGLPRNPGTMFTVSMEVPLFPEDESLAREMEQKRSLPAEPQWPSAHRITSSTASDSKDEWDAYKRDVLCPLLERVGEKTPALWLERAPGVSELRNRFFSHGPAAMTRSVESIEAYLTSSVKHKTAYLVKALLDQMPEGNSSTPSPIAPTPKIEKVPPLAPGEILGTGHRMRLQMLESDLEQLQGGRVFRDQVEAIRSSALQILHSATDEEMMAKARVVFDAAEKELAKPRRTQRGQNLTPLQIDPAQIPSARE